MVFRDKTVPLHLVGILALQESSFLVAWTDTYGITREG
jgi:hypothetical protein